MLLGGERRTSKLSGLKTTVSDLCVGVAVTLVSERNALLNVGVLFPLSHYQSGRWYTRAGLLVHLSFSSSRLNQWTLDRFQSLTLGNKI